jgi:hypothetical protein
MEYESPIKDGATTYIIPIRTTRYLHIKYNSVVSGSHTTPPADSFEFTSYIADMASLYEEYSQKWFDRHILSIFFIKNLVYSWDYMTYEPYTSPPKYESIPIEVQQTWCPVKLVVQINKFTIYWKLINNNYNNSAPESVISGETPVKKSEEVPYSRNQIVMVLRKTPRSEHHRKIRMARILLEGAKVRLNKLLLRYTEKYGEITNTSDSHTETDSVLSSDSEDK